MVALTRTLTDAIERLRGGNRTHTPSITLVTSPAHGKPSNNFADGSPLSATPSTNSIGGTLSKGSSPLSALPEHDNVLVTTNTGSSTAILSPVNSQSNYAGPEISNRPVGQQRRAKRHSTQMLISLDEAHAQLNAASRNGGFVTDVAMDTHTYVSHSDRTEPSNASAHTHQLDLGNYHKNGERWDHRIPLTIEAIDADVSQGIQPSLSQGEASIATDPATLSRLREMAHRRGSALYLTNSSSPLTSQTGGAPCSSHEHAIPNGTSDVNSIELKSPSQWKTVRDRAEARARQARALIAETSAVLADLRKSELVAVQSLREVIAQVHIALGRSQGS